MTQQEWEAASEKERNAEYERCKDPVYFYNTYWVKADGSKPGPITKEQWYIIKANVNEVRFKRRTPRRNYPMTINESYLPEFIKP